jgi:hypothetical protein
MALTLSRSSGEVFQFWQTAPPHVRSFRTPLKDLPRFVATLLSPFQVEEAIVVIDQIVFEPKTLIEYCQSRGLEIDNVCGYSLTNSRLVATGQSDVTDLLVAALADWVDFLFVPSPGGFTLFADHDEYTTAYASQDATLKLITLTLGNAGFESVANYTRIKG